MTAFLGERPLRPTSALAPRLSTRAFTALQQSIGNLLQRARGT
jgi:hypothetical protein